MKTIIEPFRIKAAERSAKLRLRSANDSWRRQATISSSTTRANIEFVGARPLDLPIPEAADSQTHLVIPRRLPQSHIDYVVEAILEVFSKREQIRGIEITYLYLRC